MNMAWIPGALAFVLLLTAPSAARAQAATDSGSFIVRLGTDTVGVEQWTRRGDTFESVRVGRSPSTTVQKHTLRVSPDSAIALAQGFYAPYAAAFAKASAARDTLVAMPMVSGTATQNLKVRRTGPDAFELVSPAGTVTMRARLTRDGNLLWLDVGSTTTVERVRWFDIDALAREFTARDERGAGLGSLSPADTVRMKSAGANIMIAYSRPAARGRTIFGGLVPYGRVWRTGANNATEFTTDRPVMIGALRLAPGKYALLTVPGRTDWHLILNRRTGMAGAMANDAEQEVGRTLMSSRALPAPVDPFTIRLDPTREGAVLRMQWESTEAFVPIVIEDARFD